MQRGAGLSLYMLAARARARQTGSPLAPPASVSPDPQGNIWLVVQRPESLMAARALVTRLRAMGVTAPVLLGLTFAHRLDGEALPGCTVVRRLRDTPRAIHALIAEARPAVILLIGDTLWPTLLTLGHEAGARLLVAAHAAPALPGGWGLWPGLFSRLAGMIDRVFVADPRDREALRMSGLGDAQVEVSGPMGSSVGAVPCNDAERAVLSEQLRLRPVWLALGVPQAEDAAVIAAHGAALRLSHRLVLLLHPDDPARGAALRAQLSPRFAVAQRSRDEPLGPDIQVYLADTEEERGLWYRLATICYMGGSFSDTGSLRDPMEPAALGAAVVHGPQSGPHAEAFRQLRLRGGTLAVARTSQLGAAISRLIEPNQAAQLAQAAWEVTSAGASASDRVAEAIVEALLEGKAKQ